MTTHTLTLHLTDEELDVLRAIGDKLRSPADHITPEGIAYGLVMRAARETLRLKRSIDIQEVREFIGGIGDDPCRVQDCLDRLLAPIPVVGQAP